MLDYAILKHLCIYPNSSDALSTVASVYTTTNHSRKGFMTTLHIVLSDFDITHAVFSKVTQLQNRLSANVVWYIHHHQGFFERHYFANELANISETLQTNAQNSTDKIQLKIKQHFPKSPIHICKEKYWSQHVDNNADALDPKVIIKAKSGLSSADHQYISNNKSTIFILGQEKWFSDGKAIGAIDPFHEDDGENKSDINVVNFMRKWCSAVEQKEVFLLHVIHIPPLAIEYEKQIETLHKEQIYRFAKTVKCAKDLLTFTRGTPEHALVSYANDNKIDLIALGCREHSLFDKWLNGSTISALINNQTADMVLINSA
jgi:nucleotide-binding universal stress UspA family protein